MVDVTAASQSILAVMLDWLSVIVVFMIIYFLFQLFTNGEGFKGLKNLFGGKDDSGSGKDKGGRKDKGDGKDKDGGDSGGDSGSGGVDFDSLGLVRVIVRNIDDEPIQNVKVTLYPSKAKWFFKKIGKKGRYYKGTTNKGGIFPNTGAYLPVPSGTLKYKVEYKLPKDEIYKSAATERTLFLRKKPVADFSQKSDYEVTAGEHHDIDITLSFNSEYAEGYEPHIEAAKQGKSPTEALYVRGVIKEL